MRRLQAACFLIAMVSVAAAIACRGSGSARPTETPGTPPPTQPPIETLTAPPTVTSSGLQITDIVAGTGDEAQAGDYVYINYNEWLTDGTWVDTNVGDNPTPIPVRLTLRQGLVVAGLIEGISGMKVGGKRRLVIPPELGFGAQGSGNVIPPNATLIYDIELVRVSHP